MDPGYRGTIHFISSDPQAVLPADYKFTGGDNGVHVFSGGLTLKSAGNRSVTTTDTASPAIAGFQTVTVTSGPARTLTVVGASPSAAGAAHTVTVTAKDAFGNTVTGYLGSIHLTSSDPAAVLPADYTFIPSDKGAHGPIVTFKTAGSRSVTATDKTTATISGSQTVKVTPGAAKSLTVVTATSFVAGGPHTVTITAKDAYGNTATGYLGRIHFTSTDTKAVLPADYTFLSGDKGVHAFSSGLTFKTAGSRSVTATDKTTASVKGSQTGIVVSPGAAKTFKVSTANPYVHGVTHSVTITVLDACDNVVTGYTGTIHFTSSDSAAGLPADYTFVAGDSGARAMTLTLRTVGTQTVTVTDKNRASVTGSQTVSVD